MASNSFSPDESLQPVHQPTQDAQFFKVPVTPQVQQQITPQNYMYSEKKIFGLRLVTFWLSLALCIVIIAGVIGGAVGGVFAPADRCTVTGGHFTNLSVPAPSTVNTLFLDCPAISSTTYTAHNSSNIFALTCDIDYPSYLFGNEDIIDIVAYSMQDCMQACSELVDHGFAPCAGATFLSTMSAFPVGNCYLKGSLGTVDSATSNTFVFGRLL